MIVLKPRAWHTVSTETNRDVPSLVISRFAVNENHSFYGWLFTVVSLSRRSPDELLRILMDWLNDEDFQAFCGRYLEEMDLKWIQR